MIKANVFAVALVLASAAHAQSPPNPLYQYGVTRTVGQINNDFARKQDWLGAAPIAYNPVTTAVTANNIGLTGANLTGGSFTVFVDVQTVISNNATLTLPSVATTVLAMQAVGINPAVGQTYEMDIYNDQSGTFNFTLTADAGSTWTLLGSSQTIAKGTARKYLVTLTTLTAGTMRSLGSFALSP